MLFYTNFAWNANRGRASVSLAKTIVSFTTDLGVELGLHKLRSSLNLDEYVPGFQSLFQETEVVVENDQDEASNASMEHSQVGGAEAEVVDDDGDFGSADMELEGLQGDAEVDDLLLEGEAHPPPAVEEQPSNGSEDLAKNNGIMVDDLFSSRNSNSWLHAFFA